MEAKKKRRIAWLCVLLAIALLIGALALSLGAYFAVRALGGVGDGLFSRSAVVVETEHYQINSGMMGYFFTRTFEGYYEEYEKQYALVADQQEKEELIARAMGIQSFALSLKEQNYTQLTAEGTLSAFDYYMSLAERDVTRMLTFCEGAYEQNVVLTAKDYEKIADTVAEMEQTYKNEKAKAKKAGEPYPKSFGAYLGERYGAPLTKQELRECLEMLALSEKFEQVLIKQYETDEFTDEMVERYVLDHAASFYMADHYVYTKTVNNYNKSASKYEEEKQALAEDAARLAACEDKQAFRDTVLDIIVSNEKKSYRESQWDRYFKESGYEPELAEQMLEEYFAQRYTQEYLDARFEQLYKTAYMSYTTDEQLRTWLFGTREQSYADHAKAGAVTMFQSLDEETNSVTGEVTSGFTVSVYFVDREAYRTTEITKHFGYVIFDDREAAEIFYKQYSQGDMNKDTMLALAEQMQESGEIDPFACHAADDYLQGNLADGRVRKNGKLIGTEIGALILGNVMVKGADEWLQSAKPGDCSGVLELVKVTKNFDVTSSTLGGGVITTESPVYGVLVYDGEGREYWYVQAVKGLLDMTSADWFEQNRLALTYHREVYEQIDK